MVVLWDVASGKRLNTIEMNRGYRASAGYFLVAPDWRTVYSWREKSKYERIEQEGKRMVRWTFGGALLAWDLADGKLLRTYEHDPPHGVLYAQLAPDGRTILSTEELPGVVEGAPDRVYNLWDVRSGTCRTLRDVDGSSIFSPDGRSLVAVARDKDNYARALKWIDVASGGRDAIRLPAFHHRHSVVANSQAVRSMGTRGS
jgi:hypothetical protein